MNTYETNNIHNTEYMYICICKIYKKYFLWLRLISLLAKTLRVNKIAMKTFLKISRSEST